MGIRTQAPGQETGKARNIPKPGSRPARVQIIGNMPLKPALALAQMKRTRIWDRASGADLKPGSRNLHPPTP